MLHYLYCCILANRWTGSSLPQSAREPSAICGTLKSERCRTSLYQINSNIAPLGLCSKLHFRKVAERLRCSRSCNCMCGQQVVQWLSQQPRMLSSKSDSKLLQKNSKMTARESRVMSARVVKLISYVHFFMGESTQENRNKNKIIKSILNCTRHFRKSIFNRRLSYLNT